MKKAVVVSLMLAAAILLIALTAGGALADGSGKSGMYATGCAPCHGSQAGLPSKVIIDGPTMLSPGQTGTFTVALIGAPPGLAGGIDAAITDSQGIKSGILAAGTNTKNVDNQEIVQSESLNVRVWTFNWTAPPVDTMANFRLKISLVAANGDGAANYDQLPAGAGDAWYTAQQNIHVMDM